MAMVIDSMVLGVCFACEVYYSCFVSRLLIRSGILFLSPIYALANNKNIWKGYKSCNFRTNKPSEKWTIALLNFRITKSLDHWTIRLYSIRITERKFKDWTTRTTLTTGGKFRCFGSVSNSCITCASRVTLVTTPVIKKREERTGLWILQTEYFRSHL